MKTFHSLLCITLLLGSAQSGLAEAGTLDVALHLQRQSIDLDFSGDIRDTDLNSLDIVWYEALSPRIEGAIRLGYLDITQDQHPLSEGRISQGGYAGLSLRFLLISRGPFRLSTELGYRYAETDNKTSTQNVQWRWHETRASLHGRWQVSDHFALSAGASALDINGTERSTGTIEQQQKFAAQDPYSGHLGVHFGLDQPGQIGIEITIGSLRGGQVVFQRRF